MTAPTARTGGRTQPCRSTWPSENEAVTSGKVAGTASFIFTLLLASLAGACRYVAIERATSKAEARTDALHRDRLGLIELDCHGKGRGVNRFRPASTPSPLAGTRESGPRAFPKEIPFEFGKGPRDLKKELAGDRGGVNGFHQTLESYLSTL